MSRTAGLAPYVALQPHYNLVDRAGYEADLQDLCRKESIACFPCFALAKGFLTGKYRPGRTVESARSAGASAYLDAQCLRILGSLDDLARELGTAPSAIARAWLAARPTVRAPIVSARTVDQAHAWRPALSLHLAPAAVA